MKLDLASKDFSIPIGKENVSFLSRASWKMSITVAVCWQLPPSSFNLSSGHASLTLCLHSGYMGDQGSLNSQGFPFPPAFSNIHFIEYNWNWNWNFNWEWMTLGWFNRKTWNWIKSFLLSGLISKPWFRSLQLVEFIWRILQDLYNSFTLFHPFSSCILVLSFCFLCSLVCPIYM